MESLIGYLVEGHVDFGKRRIWVRLGIQDSRQAADSLAVSPNSHYQNIVETRVTRYYQVAPLRNVAATVPARKPAPVRISIPAALSM